ncbi:MAG TPA: DUF1573 domain-containing protein, partial [Thermoanaerobaculia bacterium]|jgi:hypothetical protein|nr:DUF1573 domain-containing protein [Thermoanaerobaculia bacterium]
MKTVILALCAAFLVAAVLFADGKPKAVVAEPIKEAGTVPKGEKLTSDFVIRNDGDAVLEITQVQPACGCTVAEYDKTIAPGKTGKVHAVVDTSTFNGPIAKGVTVFTNDPATPQIELTVRATVEPYINVKPGYARYNTVQSEALEGNIVQTLWAPDGTSFDVTSVDSPWPYMKVTFHEAKPEERLPDLKGKQWKIEMHLSNDAKVGPLADYVTIHTSHPKQKIVQIPVSGFVRPVMAVTPPVGDYGQIELKEPLKKSLSVKNFATEPIKLTSVETSLKGVEAKIEPLQEGREYNIRVTLNPALGKGPFNGKLTLHTDSAKVPQLEVELKGTIL